MSAVVIIGAQWGDEGKGKVVDLWTEAADIVVRYGGGPNAGHTLVVGDQKIVVRLVPSGILRPRARCVLGQGMVVDPEVLVGELDALAARGCDTVGRLFLAQRAHLILPYHPVIDALREGAAGDAQRIGTTKRGIGPAYEDKAARRGVRAGDLRDLGRVEQLVVRALGAWAPLVRELGGELPTVGSTMEKLEPLAKRLLPLLVDGSLLVDEALRKGERMLLEGAQGTLLDLDHGTYPFVTSSSSTAGGAATGAGIGPTRITRVVGITKAYTTRVGGGPFPTELSDDIGEQIRRAGAEFGSVTGRPRRTGWLDLPGLRYAARVNGLDSLAITKLDVLTGLPEIKLCVGYDTPSGRTRELPIDELDTATPVYATLPGWTEQLSAARSLDELPPAVRSYLDFIAAETGLPADIVSVGPRRDETIVLRDPFA